MTNEEDFTPKRKFLAPSALVILRRATQILSRGWSKKSCTDANGKPCALSDPRLANLTLTEALSQATRETNRDSNALFYLRGLLRVTIQASADKNYLAVIEEFNADPQVGQKDFFNLLGRAAYELERLSER